MPSEHRTYRSLWAAAATLEQDALENPVGSTYRLVGSAVCLYFALEGFLNDLGERIAPREWSEEREFFSKGEFRGTLGKLAYLASLCDLKLDVSRRPYQSLKQLEGIRHEMVHPRTKKEHEPKKIDSKGNPLLVEPDSFKTLETLGFLSRVSSDIEAIADALVAKATVKYELELDGYGYFAFRGAIASGILWLPYDPPTTVGEVRRLNGREGS
jgi:hypothetical protein